MSYKHGYDIVYIYIHDWPIYIYSHTLFHSTLIHTTHYVYTYNYIYTCIFSRHTFVPFFPAYKLYNISLYLSINRCWTWKVTLCRSHRSAEKKHPMESEDWKGRRSFFCLVIVDFREGNAQIFCFRENMTGISLPEATKMWELLQKWWEKAKDTVKEIMELENHQLQSISKKSATKAPPLFSFKRQFTTPTNHGRNKQPQLLVTITEHRQQNNRPNKPYHWINQSGWGWIFRGWFCVFVTSSHKISPYQL